MLVFDNAINLHLRIPIEEEFKPFKESVEEEKKQTGSPSKQMPKFEEEFGYPTLPDFENFITAEIPTPGGFVDDTYSLQDAAQQSLNAELQNLGY